jgi:hypothetical protein
MTKIAESASGSGSESGFFGQRHRSADPDPDPHQNVMDPQYCLKSRPTKINLYEKRPEKRRQFSCGERCRCFGQSSGSLSFGPVGSVNPAVFCKFL